MSTAKIAFPPPPPTVNSLTAHQRAQLVRTTKKLSQVLGTTPQFLDATYPLGPMLVDLPFDQRSNIFAEPLEKYRSRSSIDSISSSSTASIQGSRTSTLTTHSAKTLTDLVNTMDSWRVHHPTRRPPMLRLAMTTPANPPPANIASVKPALDTIPASPASPPPSFTLSCSRSNLSSPIISPTPSFTIPSEATIRKSKMDRLRRKLGDDVPVNLVFPDEASSITTLGDAVEGGKTVIMIKVARTTGRQSLGAIIESADEHGASCSEGFADSVLSLHVMEDTRRRLPWTRRFFGGKNLKNERMIEA